jgi:hypothetical protein
LERDGATPILVPEIALGANVALNCVD